jgi:penicillin-binding protein 1A
VGCEDRAAHFRSITLGQGANMALPIWGLYMQKIYADPSLKISKRDFDYPNKPVTVSFDCETDATGPSTGTSKKQKVIDPDEF